MENATETNLQFASYPGVILHPDPLNRSRFRGPMLARLKSRCQFTSYLRNVYLHAGKAYLRHLSGSFLANRSKSWPFTRFKRLLATANK